MSQIKNTCSSKNDIIANIVNLEEQMRKVKLRMKEFEKYQKIKELVDHGGNKKHVALQLGITVRQVNRLIKIYKEKGKARFCAWQPLKETCYCP